MKKKILSFVLAFIMCIGVFAGCSLVERDSAKYANQVIATIQVGDYSEDITREQVLNWWQNPVGLSGYYYMYYSGKTMQESLEMTVDDVIDYRIRVYKAKQTIGNLTENDINNIKTSIYDSIYSTLESYVTEIKEEWNIEDEKEEETEESGYLNKKTDFTFVIDIDADGIIQADSNGNPARLQTEDKVYTAPIFNYAKDELIAKEAWKRFVMSRQSYAKDQGETCSTDQEAFQWEYNRLYKIYEDSLYITKYQTRYTNSLVVDDEAVFEKYITDYMASYDKYAPIFTGDDADELNEKALDAYIKAMQEGNTGIYYHPTDASVDFNRVVHILFKYTDAMITEIKDLKAQLTNGEINQDAYDTAYELLTSLDRKWVQYRNADGIVKDEDGNVVLKSPNEIYAEINAILAQIDAGEGDYANLTDYQKLQKRASVFLDYSYMYSEDAGFFSTSSAYTYFGYVINVGANDNSVTTTEYTNAARALAEDAVYGKTGGNMAAPVYHEDLTGITGAYTGVHIVFNMGEVVDYFGYDKAKNETLTWEDLASKETMLGSGVTLLDYIYSKVNTDSTKLNDRVKDLIEETRNSANITTYLKRLKDLYK